MIKKLSKNKKGLVAVLVSVALVIGAGATYAWFTDSKTVKTEVEMGSLRITAEFQDLGSNIYEPGDTPSSDGYIKNVGSIGAVVSVSEDVKISFLYADNNFTKYTERQTTADTEGAVKTELAADTYGFGMDSEGSLTYAWFVDASTGDKYILLAPGAKVEVSIEAELVGDVMGNKYQEALINIGNVITATQTYDGAMTQAFGVTFDDIDMYFGNSNGRAANIVPEVVMNQILEYFHR